VAAGAQPGRTAAAVEQAPRLGCVGRWLPVASARVLAVLDKALYPRLYRWAVCELLCAAMLFARDTAALRAAAVSSPGIPIAATAIPGPGAGAIPGSASLRTGERTGGGALLHGFDPQSLPILVVDDESDNLDAFKFNFRKSFTILTAQSGTEGLGILLHERVAVVITDQRMPRMSGLEFLQRARAVAPDAVPIILTAYQDADVLIEAINQGDIYRYLTKPWDAKELRGVLLQALERYWLRQENQRMVQQLQQYAGYLNQEWHSTFNFGQLVGEAPALQAALQRAEQVARTSATVLLRGESGTGKELVAHAIHINSPRESRPFVRVNCAALATGVLESELFGHERGAFTGAVARHPGRFELADGGTIFLDEIGDLPMEIQVKLLRVLQERSFERVGSNETQKVNVRVISATHRNLEQLVSEGKFREDLYYRLNVFSITLPPLRERLSDVPMLCQHFLHKWRSHSEHSVTGIDSQALQLLMQYPFPGNVRELENLIERALILASGPLITTAELEFGRPGQRLPIPDGASASSTSGTAAPAEVAVWSLPAVASAAEAGAVSAQAAAAGRTLAPPRSLQQRLFEQERAEIIDAIERCEGNIAGAARTLGVNRSTLYYRLRKHDLLHLLPTRPEPEPDDGG
jgi:two-component system response regulator AtoC